MMGPLVRYTLTVIVLLMILVWALVEVLPE